MSRALLGSCQLDRNGARGRGTGGEDGVRVQISGARAANLRALIVRAGLTVEEFLAAVRE